MESANQNSNDLGVTPATPAITISPPIINGTQPPSSGSTNPTAGNVATSSHPLTVAGPSDGGLTGDSWFDKAPSTGFNYSSGQRPTESNFSVNLLVQAPKPEHYGSAMGSNNGDHAMKKMKTEDGTARRQYLPTGTGMSGQMGGSYTGSERNDTPEVTNPKKRKSAADSNMGASPLALPPHFNMTTSSSSANHAQSSSPRPPPAAYPRQNFSNTSGTNNSHLNTTPQAGPSNYQNASYSSRNPFAPSPTAGNDM